MTVNHAEAVAKAIAERRQLVVELTAQGLSTREIAGQLGVSARTVERDRHAIGITRPHPPWTAPEHHRALAMLVDGASLHEVADTLGRSYDAVIYRFKHMGWTGAQTGAYNAMRAWEKRMLG